MPPDLNEPYKVAKAVLKMNLKYCVLTMTTRDDLSDGGAYHIVQTIETMRKMVKNLNLELLVSDLNGNWSALENILAAHPEVLNHNIETVPRLYSDVRPKANYKRSLKLLSKASKHLPPLITKSGIMLGLGESKVEILQTMEDLRKVGCQILTLGQYLAPSPQHHPVIRYLPPEEFAQLKMEAIKFGFSATASSPLVRSSFQAEALFHAANSQGRSAPT
jgi:lipoic acid synthetase